MELKQVIVVRSDLKLSKGKAASQVAHAAVECVLKSDKSTVKEWRSEGMKKIVLKVSGKDDIFRIKQSASDAGLVSCVITDAGITEVEPGTVTCIGIGPDSDEKIDKITSYLKAF